MKNIENDLANPKKLKMLTKIGYFGKGVGKGITSFPSNFINLFVPSNYSTEQREENPKNLNENPSQDLNEYEKYLVAGWVVGSIGAIGTCGYMIAKFMEGLVLSP